MLRVTLEMVPFGIESEARDLGMIEISNVGGDLTIGKYNVEFCSPDAAMNYKIKSFARRRGGWSLAALAIRKFINLSKEK